MKSDECVFVDMRVFVAISIGPLKDEIYCFEILVFDGVIRRAHKLET